MKSRAMSRNEAEYGRDTEDFRPERFVDSTAQDPDQYVFGFGRRYVHSAPYLR
jgi:hypothetical protein